MKIYDENGILTNFAWVLIIIACGLAVFGIPALAELLGGFK